jgi:hypothetical protein
MLLRWELFVYGKCIGRAVYLLIRGDRKKSAGERPGLLGAYGSTGFFLTPYKPCE